MKHRESRLRLRWELIREFGLANAVRLGLQKLQGRDVRHLRMPEIKSSLYFRTGTIDLLVLRKIFLRRDCDPELKEPLQVIVDGGANVGYWSVRMANEYPEARIVSVEPDPSNFRMLQRNTASYPTIHPIHGAIWHEGSMVRISNPRASHEAFRVEGVPVEGDAEPGVQGYSIPDLLGLVGTDRIDLLKLDIEGAEKELLLNDPDSWLHRVGILVVEAHEEAAPGCTDVITRVLTKRGRLIERLGKKGYVFDLRDP